MDDAALTDPRFPRSAAYHPEWVRASASGGAHSLWLTEWLSDAMDLNPGMRVLDLGAGRGASSVFLRREFGVQVWSADLWFPVDERAQRFRDAGVDDSVFPIHADARSLPFAREFFDAIVCIDSYVYYGTDDLYLGYLSRFLRPEGQIGIAGAGLVVETDLGRLEHLRRWWEPSLTCLHSADWWRHHWTCGGLVDVEQADALDDGWRLWLQWQHAVAPDNAREIEAIEADAGRHLGYVRAVARRRADLVPDDPISTVPADYQPKPLLAETGGS